MKSDLSNALSFNAETCTVDLYLALIFYVSCVNAFQYHINGKTSIKTKSILMH